MFFGPLFWFLFSLKSNVLSTDDQISRQINSTFILIILNTPTNRWSRCPVQGLRGAILCPACAVLRIIGERCTAVTHRERIKAAEKLRNPGMVTSLSANSDSIIQILIKNISIKNYGPFVICQVPIPSFNILAEYI